MQIVVKEYLKRLREGEKPKRVHERRHVPTIEDIAMELGVTRQAASEFVNNRTESVNRNFISGTLKLLRECGFDPKLTDIVSE